MMNSHTNEIIEDISLYQSLIKKRQFNMAWEVLSKIHGVKNLSVELADFFALENEVLQHNGVNFKNLEYQNKLITKKASDHSGIKQERIDHEHDWYFNDEVAQCILKSWRKISPQLLPSSIHRLLVIGNNLDMSTGVFRPISHVLNFLYHHGGFNLSTIQFNNDINKSEITKTLEAFDLIIINGIQQVCHVKELTVWLENNSTNIPVYGYVHETKWIFDQLNQTEIQRLKNFIQHSHILLCSKDQVSDISNLSKAPSMTVVHNPTLCETLKKNHKVTNLRNPSRLNHSTQTTTVIMVGSIIKRKGYEFFSECAHTANRYGNYIFQWVGKHRDASIRLDPEIDYPGEVASKEVEMYLRNSNIFFLSSIDDTFPLVVVEAYINGCKLLLPKTTGIAKYFKNLSGVIIYDRHDADHIAIRLKELQEYPTPTTNDQELISKNFGLSTYLERFFKAINQSIPEAHTQSLSKLYESQKRQKITIFLHLYHTDLVFELSRELEAIVNHECTLIVTLPTSKSTPGSIQWLESIFIKRFNKVFVIPCDNRGLDIYPFFKSIEFLAKHQPEALEHDHLILKIHSKRSFTSSGIIKGNRWRRGLLKGLLGTRENCSKLISFIESNDSIGLAAPEQFLMDKSLRDLQESNNKFSIDQLIECYGISQEEGTKKFIRGTMFWTKSSLLIQPLTRHKLPSREEFPPGYSSDGTLAHAFERVLSYIPLNQNSFLPIPKKAPYQYLTVELLNNKEIGKSLSIYSEPFIFPDIAISDASKVSLCTNFEYLSKDSKKLFDYGLLVDECSFKEEENALEMCKVVIAIDALKSLRSPSIYYLTDSTIQKTNKSYTLKNLSRDAIIDILSAHLGCINRRG